MIISQDLYEGVVELLQKQSFTSSFYNMIVDIQDDFIPRVRDMDVDDFIDICRTHHWCCQFMIAMRFIAKDDRDTLDKILWNYHKDYRLGNL